MIRMRDIINIEIEIERLNEELPRINSLIRCFAKDLGEIKGIIVKNYTQIKNEFKVEK